MFQEEEHREYLYDQTAGHKRPNPYVRSTSGSLLDAQRPGFLDLNRHSSSDLDQMTLSNRHIVPDDPSDDGSVSGDALSSALDMLVSGSYKEASSPESASLANPRNPIVSSVVSYMTCSPHIYRAAVTKILDNCRLVNSSRDVYANVTHSVPLNQVTALNSSFFRNNRQQLHFQRQQHHTQEHATDHHDDPAYSHISYSHSIYSSSTSAYSPSEPASPVSDISDDNYIISPTSHRLPQPSYDTTGNEWPYIDQIPGVFNTLSMDRGSSGLAVPPMSMDFSLSVDLLPIHNYRNFETSFSTRYEELAPGGTILFVYPTSLRFYNHSVLPCLDLALYHMLALNLISSHQCELISRLPEPNAAPSFEAQIQFIQGLQGANVLYGTEFKDYQYEDWGRYWLHYELDWLKNTIRRACNESNQASQTLVKLVQTMMANKAWNIAGHTQVGVFVVRKSA